MSDLCALDDVKTYLGITTNAEDALIKALITQASAQIENYCNRTFAQTTYTETRNGRGSRTMFMRQIPIVSVTALTIDGVTVQASSNPQTYGYVFDDERIYLRGTSPSYGPYGQPDCFSRGVQNVVVTYTAGFSAIPGDVAQACIELVAWKRAKRNRIDKTSETLGTQQTQAYSLADMPASVKSAINSYRVPMVPA